MTSALIGVIIAIILVYLLYRRTNLFQGSGIVGVKTKESNLRAQCRELLKMPSDEADKVIDRLIERQREKNPGQSEEWYLDKVLFDLQKDKQR